MSTTGNAQARLLREEGGKMAQQGIGPPSRVCIFGVCTYHGLTAELERPNGHSWHPESQLGVPDTSKKYCPVLFTHHVHVLVKERHSLVNSK